MLSRIESENGNKTEQVDKESTGGVTSTTLPVPEYLAKLLPPNRNNTNISQHLANIFQNAQLQDKNIINNVEKDSATTEDMNTDEENDPVIIVKEEIKNPIENTLKNNSTVEKVKKPRGRPPTKLKPNQQVQPHHPPPILPQPQLYVLPHLPTHLLKMNEEAKKRRGRPPKNPHPLLTSTPALAPNNTSTQTTIPSSPITPSNPIVALPPSTVASPSIFPSSSTPSQDSSLDGNSDPKRKRGRPPKPKPETDPTQVVAKRGRGRPPKGKDDPSKPSKNQPIMPNFSSVHIPFPIFTFPNLPPMGLGGSTLNSSPAPTGISSLTNLQMPIPTLPNSSTPASNQSSAPSPATGSAPSGTQSVNTTPSTTTPLTPILPMTSAPASIPPTASSNFMTTFNTTINPSLHSLLPPFASTPFFNNTSFNFSSNHFVNANFTPNNFSEDSQTPTKRPRGRPPKPKGDATTSQGVPIIPSVGTPSQLAPHIPSILLTSTSMPIPSLPEGNDPKVKRPRGRPRKKLSDDGVEKIKRTRGRPKKVAKLDEMDEIHSSDVSRTQSSDVEFMKLHNYNLDQSDYFGDFRSTDKSVKKKGPPKKRGRPPKSATLTQPINPTIDDHNYDSDIYSNEESDVEEEKLYFYEEKDIVNQLKPLNNLDLNQKNQLKDKRLLTKIVDEKIIEINKKQGYNNNDEIIYFKSIECYLSDLENIKMNEKRELLCPSCALKNCHKFCSYKEVMVEIKDTVSWLIELNTEFPHDHTEFSQKLQQKLREATNSESQPSTEIVAKNFEKLYEKLKNNILKPKWQQKIENFNARMKREIEAHCNIIKKFGEKFVSTSQELHSIGNSILKLQKSLYKYLKHHYVKMTKEDCLNLVRLCKLLLLLSESEHSALEAWNNLNFLPLPSEDLENFNLFLFQEHIMDLYRILCFIEKHERTQSENQPQNGTEAFLASERAEKSLTAAELEEKAELKEMLLKKYSESLSASPQPPENTVAIYFTFLSRNEPAAVVKNLFHRLERELNLQIVHRSVSEQSRDAKQHVQVFAAEKKINGCKIACLADNHGDEANPFHLLIKLYSLDLTPHLDIIKNEIKRQFRLDSLDEYLSVIEYKQFEAQWNNIQLNIITRELPVVLSDPSSSSFPLPVHSQVPSTLFIGSKDGEEILRCILNYSFYHESNVSGPTIQYIHIPSRYRNQHYASSFIHWLVCPFLPSSFPLFLS